MKAKAPDIFLPSCQSGHLMTIKDRIYTTATGLACGPVSRGTVANASATHKRTQWPDHDVRPVRNGSNPNVDGRLLY